MRVQGLSMKRPLSAAELRRRRASLPRAAWTGRPFESDELELLRDVLLSIRDDQPGASSAVKALAAAALELEGGAA